MTETYPDDTTLLGLTQDEATGVEYIPTGQSPYIMAYRRMLYRLLRASERANDLRVYERGGRMVGVRAGRCFVGQQARVISEPSPIELAADATTHLYIDAAGVVVASTAGLPADRATFIPLAEAVTDASRVLSLTDLRGESLLQAQTAALAGITATADEINQALDGIDADVTAANLSILTGGAFSTANTQHRHLTTTQNTDGPAAFSFVNLSTDSAATVALDLSLPNRLADVSRLEVDSQNGFLRQQHLLDAFHLVGVTTLSWTHAGALAASVTGQLIGAVPVAGEVMAVVLSVGLNTQSSDNADGLSAMVSVNGQPLTSTPAQLSTADGSGFRCTDQGDGAAATIVSTGDQAVGRGDLVSIDLTYTANGTVTQMPTDIAALVVIKADAPI